ncbi:MAG: TRAP transporter small permease [Synergistales bacterium]|nr:TRAP transporter small permease [Synergistales bacterium]
MKVLHSINEWIDYVLRKAITLSLGLMLIIIFVQVVSRYVFHNSLSFSEELARYLFVWTVFLGIPVVQRMGRHMTVGLLTQRFRGKTLKALRIAAYLLTFLFMVILLQNGMAMVQRVVWQTSPALQIKMSYVYYAIPVGSGAMLLNLLEQFLETLLTPAEKTLPELHDA